MLNIYYILQLTFDNDNINVTIFFMYFYLEYEEKFNCIVVGNEDILASESSILFVRQLQ